MLKILKNPKFSLVVALAIVVPFIAINWNKPNKVLGTSAAAPIISSPTPTPEPSPSPSPKLSKTVYKIALFGDSMIDTMGDMKYLSEALAQVYPETHFILYNYGIGSQNVEKGLARFNSQFSYQDRNYPPISQVSADIIVLGSFAYNPLDPHDKNKHYSKLLELTNLAKGTNASVYLLAEIAPLKNKFGVGPHGINWPPELAYSHTLKIIDQLENVFAVANLTKIPVIDVFHQSIATGKWGSAVYTNADDGIHPSVEGHALTAQIIAQKIKLK